MHCSSAADLHEGWHVHVWTMDLDLQYHPFSPSSRQWDSGLAMYSQHLESRGAASGAEGAGLLASTTKPLQS